jgi:hypothetical protein
MKQYRKNIIRLLAIEASPTLKLSQNFLKSKKKNIINQLKIHWEIFLSTYQYSKQNLFELRTYDPPKVGFSVDLKGVNRYSCAPMSFQGTKNFSSEGLREINFFYLKQENFSYSNYFILAKLVDLIGTKYSVQNKFRQLIKINTKYLELEKFFKIKVFKNTFLFYWCGALLFEQIYQFIQMNSFFLYQANLISPFGPVWGNKKKIEIQNNGKKLFLKNKDLLMLKWYQNKINTWSEGAQRNKKTSLNQYNQDYEVIVPPTSYIRISLLGKGCVFGLTNTISYSQDETNNLSQHFRRENCFMLHTSLRASGKINNFTKLSNGFIQKYLRVIKKIIQKSKVTTQVELIQKLNKIIVLSDADPFMINDINKRSVTSKLNRIIYQFLWRWGLVRHRNQKSKWIKNRYWSLQ